MFMGRPQTNGCNTGFIKTTPIGPGTSMCNDVGPFSCPANIGPRKNRERVRQQLRDYILLKLGAPKLQLELDDQQLDLAIDEAMSVYEDFAPRDFFDYHTFLTTSGKSVYTMNADIGLIRNVFYKEQGNFSFQSSDLGGALPVEYFYPGGSYASIQGGLIDPLQPIWGRAGEWTGYKMYEGMYNRISSNLGGWEWVSDNNTIKLYPTPCGCHRVFVHYIQKCKDWKEPYQALREGSLAYAKEMLGLIRRKFTNIPGPQGGIQLDGASLVQEAREDIAKWQERLISVYSDLPFISMD